MSPSPPDDKKSAPESGNNPNSEHPVLTQLYADLAAAQAGRQLRIDETHADLAKVDEQRATLTEQLDAIADGDDQAQQIEDQLAELDEIEVVLRHSLGPSEEPTTDVARQPS